MLRRLILFFRRRIAVKLTLTLLAFVAVVEVVAGLYLTRALEERAVQVLEGRLVALARLLQDDARPLFAPGASPRARREFALKTARATDARVTLILPDGRVVAESDRPLEDLAKIESHRDRPEVRDALATGVGRAVRRSEIVGQDLLYAALPVRDGARTVGIIRLALSLEVVTGAYASIRQVLVAGGLLALGVALGIGLFVARRVTRPVIDMQSVARQMAGGDFSVRAPVRSPDEIGGLGRALNVMASRFREKIQDLGREQATITAILDSMVEGVLAVDAHDHLLLLNQSVRAMFRLGLRPGEGKPFLEVIRNADLLDLLRACREARGEMVSRELSLTTPVERILDVHALPLRVGGEGTGVLMVLHDVTQLRRLERVRTEFVANVSHELRTPLTAIRGYLETLLEGGLDERDNARRFLEIVSRHTERLGRLLDDLTDLSNIELGKVALELQPTELGEALEAVVAIIEPRAAGKDVSLAADLPPDLPRVLADADRLAQILINLLDNAVKFTPAGGRVTVTAAARDQMVEIAVADTGIGIPSTDLPRITERFYRVDKARSRELGGTGLGLAIVKHLVQAHGGALGIESEAGKGTTVRFTLPLA
ncbi:MAG: HAMP domain-containing protein [Candidatus Rokubacteria bacterium]|nr:HAMP domain-containing protein [Candidatus Rokubacteria bacterium]